MISSSGALEGLSRFGGHGVISLPLSLVFFLLTRDKSGAIPQNGNFFLFFLGGTGRVLTGGFPPHLSACRLWLMTFLFSWGCLGLLSLSLLNWPEGSLQIFPCRYLLVLALLKSSIRFFIHVTLSDRSCTLLLLTLVTQVFWFHFL